MENPELNGIFAGKYIYYMSKNVYLGMIGDIIHSDLINIINKGAKYGDLPVGLFTYKTIASHKRLPYLI